LSFSVFLSDPGARIARTAPWPGTKLRLTKMERGNQNLPTQQVTMAVTVFRAKVCVMTLGITPRLVRLGRKRMENSPSSFMSF
jgi:hypothetical protein